MSSPRPVLEVSVLFQSMKHLVLFKVCPRCKATKPIADFPKRDRKSKSPGAYCLPCTRAFNREYYSRSDSTKQRLRVHRNSKMYRARNRRHLWNYLLSHPCVDCGERDPVVLEFDHIKPKRKSVSRLASSSVCWSKVEAEIARCEVRCANCHRRRTAVQFNWKVYPTDLGESVY